MPLRRPAVLAGLLLLLLLRASAGLGQEVRRSKVYEIPVDKVVLHLAELTSVAPAGSVILRPGRTTAELRLRLDDMDVAAEDFRQAGFQKANLGAYCPIGWFHLHLGSVPCPREGAAACATICFAHPMCSATLSWIAYTGICQDTCKCDPED